jgi:3-oxoacyl-[acyl-carrier protein] reductase
MNLKGKKIIVTGGANGIGLSLVKALEKKQCIICVIDKDITLLERFRESGNNIVLFHADVSSYRQVRLAIESFINQHGNIDIVVNNAGILIDFPLVAFNKKVKESNLKKWRAVIETNLGGVFLVSSIVAENMIRNHVKGLIINISSISSFGNKGQTAYAASKAGVNAMTITWAKELSQFGIRVAGIAPGFINTSMFLESMNEGLRDELLKKVLLKRAGEPEEIVETLLFIIHNDYVNGHIFYIDGGTEL